MSKQNRVTVVTGAAGSLGSAVARHLASRGHRVVACDLDRSAERLAAVVDDLEGEHLAPTLDATNAAQWRAVLARATSDVGAPTGAVLVAGGWKGGTEFHDAEDQSVWDFMFKVNLETAEKSLRALLPGMVERQEGSIVVIGTRAVARPWTSKRAAGYAASKAALMTLMRTVAAEVLDEGVRINAILPSVIDTEANRRAMPEAKHETWVAPDALAKVIGFLLSDDSAPISGAEIPTYGRA